MFSSRKTTFQTALLFYEISYCIFVSKICLFSSQWDILVIFELGTWFSKTYSVPVQVGSSHLGPQPWAVSTIYFLVILQMPALRSGKDLNCLCSRQTFRWPCDAPLVFTVWMTLPPECGQDLWLASSRIWPWWWDDTPMITLCYGKLSCQRTVCRACACSLLAEGAGCREFNSQIQNHLTFREWDWPGRKVTNFFCTWVYVIFNNCTLIFWLSQSICLPEFHLVWAYTSLTLVTHINTFTTYNK